MEDVELAAELGRAYRGVSAHLTPPIPMDLVDMLGPLDVAMASPSSLRAMSNFVRDRANHIRGGNPVAVSFFAEHPLDHILMTLRADPSVLLTEAWVHEMLRHVLTAFFLLPSASLQRKLRHCERLADGLPVVEALREAPTLHGDAPCAGRCVDLLLFMCQVSRDYVRNPDLFRTLARHKAHWGRLMKLVEVGEFFAETSLVEDLFVALVQFIVRETRYAATVDRDVMDFVERLLRENAELRAERFVTHTIQLWRTKWPVYVGGVVAQLLETTDVAFVVGLDAEDRLTELIAAARAHAAVDDGGTGWCAAYARLSHLIPGRAGGRVKAPSRRHARCPITLDAITYPVIIADGHVYERDAIMRHFAANGFVSPLTRQRVAPHVFHVYDDAAE